jgi:hypothetical protein
MPPVWHKGSLSATSTRIVGAPVRETIPMRAALLSVLLLSGTLPDSPGRGQPSAVAAEVRPAPAAARDSVQARPTGNARDIPGHPTRACDGDGAKMVPAVSYRPFYPMVHTDYVPGAMPYPDNSWFKHSYLAYRGNYFCNGYDYQQQFNYPWHHSYGPCCGVSVNRGAPPPAEAIPTPASASASRRSLKSAISPSTVPTVSRTHDAVSNTTHTRN